MKWVIPARPVLIPYILLALGGLAVLLWLYITPPPPPTYLPGPSNVQTVYETKWKEKVKPVPYLVPTGARIEFFPQAELAKASKIPDAPDNAIAFGQVPPHAGKTTVFGTLARGEDNVFRGGLSFRQEAIPFWQLKREFHGGLYYGLVGENVIEAQLRAAFLRTGPVNWQGIGRIGVERDGGRMNGAILIGAEF